MMPIWHSTVSAGGISGLCCPNLDLVPGLSRGHIYWIALPYILCLTECPIFALDRGTRQGCPLCSWHWAPCCSGARLPTSNGIWIWRAAWESHARSRQYASFLGGSGQLIIKGYVNHLRLWPMFGPYHQLVQICIDDFSWCTWATGVASLSYPNSDLL